MRRPAGDGDFLAGGQDRVFAGQRPTAGAGDDLEILDLVHVTMGGWVKETGFAVRWRETLRGDVAVAVELVPGSAVFVVSFVVIIVACAGHMRA